MLIRSDLLKYLSLFMYNVEIRHVNITLDQLCHFKTFDMKPDLKYCYSLSDNAALQLLNELTTNVS